MSAQKTPIRTWGRSIRGMDARDAGAGGRDDEAEIAVRGRELNRSKGAGKTHDAERDPGFYVDLGDNGEVKRCLEGTF